MAKNLNIKFQGDNKWLVSAVKGIQASLNGAEKSLKEFKAELQSTIASMSSLNNSARWLDTSLKSTKSSLDTAWNEALNANTKVDKLNKTLEKTAAQKFTSAIGNWFKTMASDIISTTKLLTTFATVAWGIQLYKAKTDYLDYSNQYAQLDSIVKTKWGNEDAALRKLVAEGAVNMWVAPGEFINNIKAMASWGIAIDRKRVDSSWRALSAEEQELDMIAQIENVKQISKDIWDFANIAWVSFEDSSDAIVRFWNAIWYSADQMRDPAKVQEAIGYISTTLDQGLGNLSEYATQLNKFIKEGIQSWASVAFTMAMFARQTKLGTTAMAWFSMRAFTMAMTNSEKEANAVANKIKNQIKDKKDADWNVAAFWAWNPAQTKVQRDFFAQYDTAGEVKQNLTMKKNEDWTWAMRSWEEMAYAYIDIIKKWMDIGIDPGTIISKFTTNVNQKKVLQDLVWTPDPKTWKYNMAWLTDMQAIQRAYEEEGRMATDLATKKEKLNESFSMQYRRAVASYQLWTVESAQKMSPAMSWVAKIVQNMFEWKPSNMEEFNKIISDNYEQLKESNPILAGMVSLMGRFGKYAASWELVKDLKSVGETLLFVLGTIEDIFDKAKKAFDSPAVKFIRDLFWNWAGANFIIWVGWFSLAKQLLTSSVWAAWGLLTGKIWTAITTTVWGSAWTAAWAAVWTAAWLAFKAQAILGALAIWTAIWLVIWTAVKNALDKAYDETKYKGTPEETANGTWIIKYQTLNDSQRMLLMGVISKENKWNDIGKWADKYLSHWWGFNLQNPLEQKAFAEFKKRSGILASWVSINDFNNTYWTDAVKFANAERDQQPKNFVTRAFDRYQGSPELSDMQSANAVISNFNTSIAPLYEKTTREQTATLGAKLDQLISKAVFSWNTFAPQLNSWVWPLSPGWLNFSLKK